MSKKFRDLTRDEYFENLFLPVCMSALQAGIPAEQVKEMAEKAIKASNPNKGIYPDDTLRSMVHHWKMQQDAAQ